MLPVELYNSITRKKELFKPLQAGKIKFYVCGVTVYDDCHLGHARTMVAFDVIVRFLRHIGYEVDYVKNITDVDDKIIQRAIEKACTIDELTAHYTQSMHEDAHALGCEPPTFEPKATEYIQKMVDLIERLVHKKHAYVTETGDVCFDVSSFKEYGKLSHKDLEGLVSGARITSHEGKQSAADFVLWKKAKPGEPAWSSPWGEGRPGWHIECSAMAIDTLGEQFDIHGGGLDLQFPHHENEIAQSEGATDKTFANYWMHVGMLNINQEKMSKSLGNFHTIKDMLALYRPEVLRYFLLSSHYRSALNFSDEQIKVAESALERMYLAIRDLKTDDSIDETWRQSFYAALQDDFNTPEALSVLFQLSRAINKSKSPTLASTLKYCANVLGLLQSIPENFLKATHQEASKTLSAEVIEAEIEKRNQARADKDFALADDIRASLQASGILLEDTADGTTWRREST